jgi:sec-independent protein translocase protein TatC
MNRQTLRQHLTELKRSTLRISLVFVIIFSICYYFSDNIYNMLLFPLAKLSDNNTRKIIYTSLTEAFFSYIKLAAFSAFMIITPLLSIEIYLFTSPGLYKNEKKLAAFILLLSPILFWLGAIFVYYYVMPNAWKYFLSFEHHNNAVMPIILEAKISEYLNLTIQLVIAFGCAFQTPIILIILTLVNIVKVTDLQQNRRLAVVINFIIAGILAPPDVISQFILAIPMLLLYEISIILCKYIQHKEIKC